MRNKTSHILIFLCIAAIGCYATITQVILIREFLNIFYGNELCLGVIFGAWFLGIAVGAFAGAKVEHNFKHAFGVFTIVLLVMCLVLPVQIFSVRGVRSLLSVGVGEYISLLPLLITSIGLILPFSFIIGFIFPFSSKVILGVTKDTATDIGVVYIVESMGSLVGGLLFSFYMVSRFHTFKIITLLNIGMFVLLTFLFFSFQRKRQVYFRKEYKKTKSWLCLISMGFALAMIVIWFSSIPDRIETFSAKLRWNTLNPNIELMASADSKYQHIDIGKQAEQFSIYLNGQYAAAFPNEYEYAQIAHLVMTQHPSPKHILLIGNGLGGLISEMLQYPIESLDYVELDQNLLQISGKYLSPSDKQSLSDRRVTVVHQDGRYFVKHTSKKQHYDIMVINTPDPSTAFLNRFYTFEFFREAQAILKSDGVFAASVSSAVTYIGKEIGSYTGSLYRTIHKAFRHVRVTPGQTNFYFASNTDGAVTLDIETLMARYRKQQIKSDYFTEYLFYTLLQPEQVKFIESQLSQRKDLLVNTDARPVAYFLNLVLWDSLTGGRLHGLFHGLKDVGLQSFLIPIAIALSCRIIYIIFRQFKQRGEVVKFQKASSGNRQSEAAEEFDIHYNKQLKTNCLIALATTGFTGIALEIVLLYAFQNIYGYIYERMGVIVAVFMVGLALGGYIANRFIQKENLNTFLHALSKKRINVLMAFEGIIGLYAFILPFIIHTISVYSMAAEVGLVCLVGITGLLTGLEFPLINRILLQYDRDIAISAGNTDSADHIGAFLGALLTGIIFLPLLGVFGTCLILAALNISSLILIAFSVPWCKSQK
ncbi:MAG: hypothetical protein KGI30_04315 [Planctomycetota bacterium]|nr:hypothetical protein [Planctomycetota bacterium]